MVASHCSLNAHPGGELKETRALHCSQRFKAQAGRALANSLPEFAGHHCEDNRPRRVQIESIPDIRGARLSCSFCSFCSFRCEQEVHEKSLHGYSVASGDYLALACSVGCLTRHSQAAGRRQTPGIHMSPPQGWLDSSAVIQSVFMRYCSGYQRAQP